MGNRLESGLQGFQGNNHKWKIKADHIIGMMRMRHLHDSVVRTGPQKQRDCTPGLCTLLMTLHNEANAV